jgi:hypothetical protein
MPQRKINASVEELLEAAARNGTGWETGRQIVTFKPGAHDAGVQQLSFSTEIKVAHSSDFTDHAVNFSALGDAHTLVLSEIGVAIVAPQPGTPRR